MTRAQFLNDLYRRLPGLTQEQAEQHLTYYAEMLADRMEEGMSEEDAVDSMEPVEVIAQRILQDEGIPEAPFQPPKAPELPKTDGSRFTKVPDLPKKINWRKAGMAALWVVAIVMAVFSGGRWLHRHLYPVSEAAPLPDYAGEYAVDYGMAEPAREPMWEYEDWDDWEDWGSVSFDGLYDLWGIGIGADGVYGGNFSLTSDGIFAENGYQTLHIGPGGINIGTEALAGTESTDSVIGARYRFEDDTYRVGSGTVDCLNIDWTAGAVKVRGWEEDYIRFQEFSSTKLKQSQQLRYQADGGTLSISNNVGLDKGLIVWVPVHLLNTLSVDTSTADVYLDQAAAETGYVSTTAGKIVVTSAAFNELYTQTSTGEVTMRRVCAANLLADTTGGNVYLDAVLTDSLNVSTSSGHISGYLAGNSADLETTAGNIDVKTGVAGYLEMDTSSGNVAVFLQDGAYGGVEAETTSGNVSLWMPEDWGFQLEFESDSGSFDRGPFDAVRMDGLYFSDGEPVILIDVETSSGNLQMGKN